MKPLPAYGIYRMKVHRIFVTAITSGLSIAAPTFAEFTRVTAWNFGDLESRDPNSIAIHSTNTDSPPYDGTGGGGWLQMLSASPGYQMDGVAEFKVSSVSVQSHYYLEISPTSSFSGIDIPGSIDIFWTIGDGILTAGDWGAGLLAGTVSVTDPNLVGWYNQNSIGGYSGDTYLDVTSIITNAFDQGLEFLSFRYRSSGTLTGLSLRAPVLLVGSTAIPSPAALVILAAGGLLARRRRR